MRTYYKRVVLRGTEKRGDAMWMAMVLCEESSRVADLDDVERALRQSRAKKYDSSFLDRLCAEGAAVLLDIDPCHRLLLLDCESAANILGVRMQGMLKSIKKLYHARDMRDRAFRGTPLESVCETLLAREGFMALRTRSIAYGRKLSAPRARHGSLPTSLGSPQIDSDTETEDEEIRHSSSAVPHLVSPSPLPQPIVDGPVPVVSPAPEMSTTTPPVPVQVQSAALMARTPSPPCTPGGSSTYVPAAKTALGFALLREARLEQFRQQIDDRLLMLAQMAESQS
eukprot:m51a1_g2332 hypothetical protein (283) ;mRNA; f:528838-530002